MKVHLQNKIHYAGSQTYTQIHSGRKIDRHVPQCGQRSSRFHPAEVGEDAEVTCKKCLG